MPLVAAKSLSGLRNYRFSGTNCGAKKELAAIIAAEADFGCAHPRDAGRFEGIMIGNGAPRALQVAAAIRAELVNEL
jgi:hypothetical protein